MSGFGQFVNVYKIVSGVVHQFYLCPSVWGSQTSVAIHFCIVKYGESQTQELT